MEIINKILKNWLLKQLLNIAINNTTYLNNDFQIFQSNQIIIKYPYN